MLLVPDFFLPIELLLQTLVDQYLNTSYCTTVITETPLKILPQISHRYILLNQSLGDLILDASEAGCSDFIVQISEPKRFFSALDYAIHRGLLRRSDRKIILLPSNNTEDNSLLDVLRMKESSFVVNLLLVLPSPSTHCETFDLVTHKFIGPVENDMPVYLDRWNSCSAFEKHANLFPHDMSKLDGKIVKVTCFTYTPYVLLDLEAEIVPLGRDGVEIRLMDEFCRWVNCTIEIIGDNGEEWGEVYENFTGLGVLGNVVEDRADFGITALYSWYEEFLYMDFSGYGVRTSVTCIAPSPRLLASWTMPLLPFSIYMWVGLLFTFIYEAFSLFVAQHFSAKKIFLTTFGIMITQSQNESNFKSWRIRSVVGWMMLTGLVLDNAYGGGLASTFTVPRYEPSVDTIQDMVDRKVTWAATHDAWVFSLSASQDPLIKQLVRQFHIYEPEELKRLSFTRKVAYSVERLPAGYFAIGEYIDDKAVHDFTILVQDFYYELCVVMMRKSSPYTLQMNKHIGRLHESGLMLAWERQIALSLLNYKVQIEVKLSRSKRDVETIEPISFRLVLGVFVLYGFGVVLATIAFFGEIIWNKRRKSNSRV
ncbi:unnamed protein product [Pieris brassicae]|uniref:Ionotropic glutamate receptor C-terminal domain-containing protein n=1 Tax=Pieris brassicae TaxID=7116 RepID=A0A9P0X8U9_PIEBR|nr:unnamed protein product [Pieris brassicae]